MVFSDFGGVVLKENKINKKFIFSKCKKSAAEIVQQLQKFVALEWQRSCELGVKFVVN